MSLACKDTSFPHTWICLPPTAKDSGQRSFTGPQCEATFHTALPPLLLALVSFAQSPVCKRTVEFPTPPNTMLQVKTPEPLLQVDLTFDVLNAVIAPNQHPELEEVEVEASGEDG